MNIFVTGGAGYIGSILVPKLLELGHTVVVLDSFKYRQFALVEACQYEKFSVIRGDARDESVLREQVSKADLIIPLAALVGAPLCNEDQVGAQSINADAVKSLVKLSSADQRIIMPVSNSGYGVGEKDNFCTESSPLKPISLYGRTKVAAEEMVLERNNSISFRLATVFGMAPRMRTDLLVNDFVYRAVKDRFIVIFEGHFKRNYIHIQDVASVFMHAIENFVNMKGKAYNVGLEDANLSKIELAQKIQKYVEDFQFFEAPIGEDPDKRDYIVSNKRILDSGFMPKHSLDMGIRELIKGYQILTDRICGNF